MRVTFGANAAALKSNVKGGRAGASNARGESGDGGNCIDDCTDFGCVELHDVAGNYRCTRAQNGPGSPSHGHFGDC